MEEIQKIYEEYREPLFRMALYHLISCGKDNFDDETVSAAKQAIRAQDTAMQAEGKIPVMTVPFQDNIIDCAAALTKYQITDILRFVKHNLYFDGDDKLIKRCRHCNMKLPDADGVLVNESYEDAFFECCVCHDYSMEDGSTILCESCGCYYTPNHAKPDGELPVPIVTTVGRNNRFSSVFASPIVCQINT